MANKFASQVAAFAKLANVRMDVTTRKIGFDALASLIAKSPVDKGRFRASWRVSLNSVDESFESVDFEGNGAAQRAAAMNTIARASITDEMFLSNNLPYAQPLEDGHSTQAPNGMLALTFAEVENFVGAAVSQSRREVPDA